MSEQSDLELIFLARQGNKASFSRLVWRYQPMARHLAKRAIGNEDLAEELVQDAMLQAYLSLDKLRDPRRFRSWLYGIVLNVCRDRLRRRKVICLSLETMPRNWVDEALPNHEGSPDPQQLAEQQEIHTELARAIASLSDKNRSATLLFYREQLSLQEVANRLNISVGAVKGRLHKSRHQLRQQLSPLYDRTQLTSVPEIQTMTTDTSDRPKTELICSFCQKNEKQVEMLIAGPGVLICNRCVDICNDIISEEKKRLAREEANKLDAGNAID